MVYDAGAMLADGKLQTKVLHQRLTSVVKLFQNNLGCVKFLKLWKSEAEQKKLSH